MVQDRWSASLRARARFFAAVWGSSLRTTSIGTTREPSFRPAGIRSCSRQSPKATRVRPTGTRSSWTPSSSPAAPTSPRRRTAAADPVPGFGDHDPVRDAFEIALVRAARRQGKPILGICRGMELLNVAFGGSLAEVRHATEPVAMDGFDHVVVHSIELRREASPRRSTSRTPPTSGASTIRRRSQSAPLCASPVAPATGSSRCSRETRRKASSSASSFTRSSCSGETPPTSSRTRRWCGQHADTLHESQGSMSWSRRLTI